MPSIKNSDLRSTLMKAALIGLLVISFPSTGFAMWYGENVKKSDIMMMDIRWPYWSESTYYAHWNSSIHGADDSFSFYGGYLSHIAAVPPDFLPDMDPEKQDNLTLGSNWAFWGTNKKTGEPPRVVATSRFNFPVQYIGEGGSCALYGDGWPIKRNQWYTMILRLWTPIDDPGYSYIGRWTKDVKANRWHLYGVVKIPTEAKHLIGNAGFMEDFGQSARSARSIHRRFGYYRNVKGEWQKSNIVDGTPRGTKDFGTNCVATSLENEQVFAIEWCTSQKNLPILLKGHKPIEIDKKYVIEAKQPDLPAFDPLIIKGVSAKWSGDQVTVSWSIPPESAPQLSCKVEVFDNLKCTGKPVAVYEERMPTIRNVLLTAKVRNPVVRLSVTDIFDHSSKPIVVKAEKMSGEHAGVKSDVMTPSIKSGVMSPGLTYKLYTEDKQRHINIKNSPSKTAPQSLGEQHYLVSLKELTEERISQQGISNNGIDMTLHYNRTHGYGFKFDGYLDVPRTGVYLFNVKGCDGYRITMDGKTALEWDGIHGPEDRDFFLRLEKGYHPFALEYFFDKTKPYFNISWEGPGLKKQLIPASAFFCKKSRTLPELKLTVQNAREDGKVILMKDSVITTRSAAPSEHSKPGLVKFKIDVKKNGHTLEKLHLYHNDMVVAVAEGKDLRSEYTCEILLPAGEGKVWTRLYYDKNFTQDTNAMPVNIGLAPVKGWEVGNTAEAEDKYNLIQTAPDAFTFVGEGEFTVYRKIAGDFTLTCKIDSYTGQNKEPVNPLSFLGLTVRQNGAIHYQRNAGNFFAFRRHLHSTRTSPNFGDPGGTRSSWEAYPNDMPWLRVVREGFKWTAWRSVDGKKWVYATTHYLPLLVKEMDAGLVFSSLPQDSQMYFKASLSNISLKKGLPNDYEVKIEPVKGTAKVMMTGVAVSFSNPNVVVIRTAGKGLLRTSDRGKTWSPANGRLSGAANMVRSIAIHPTNPEIMIRAAGYAYSRGKFKGGLYKTSNGGKSWKQLKFKGDFDGKGPSALCGEVVSFVQNQPDTVIVGTETKGLFRSKDGGATWEQVLPGGERFTAVKTVRFGVKTGKEMMQVFALTCPDQFMSLLGRGKSPFPVSNDTASKIYKSMNSGDTFTLSRKYDNVGSYNVSFNNYSPAECEVATSHGIIFSMNKYSSYILSNNPNLDGVRPYTAIGSSRRTGNMFSSTITQAINPDDAKVISFCGASGHIFEAIKVAEPQIKGTLKIVAGDLRLTASGKEWWFLGLDGLYYSNDLCRSFKKIR